MGRFLNEPTQNHGALTTNLRGHLQNYGPLLARQRRLYLSVPEFKNYYGIKSATIPRLDGLASKFHNRVETSRRGRNVHERV